MDSRADTCCLGKNFRHDGETGDVCNVRGFHGSFDTLTDVPIVRGVTGWTDQTTGQSYLLYVNQGLWFGDKLDHSLWNPNQIRHFGIPVSDDPYDNSRRFGIDHEKVFIPFQTRGATVFVDTFRPTEADLTDTRFIKIELTDGETEWDPQKVLMTSNRPYISQNRSVSAMEVEAHDEETYTSEFDAHLSGISGNYVPPIMAERIIKTASTSLVPLDRRPTDSEIKQVSQAAVTPRTITVSEILSTYRHNSTKPERVSKLFGISLERARWTLHTTTQKGITRTNRGPLTRRFPHSNVRFQSQEPKLPGKYYMDWVQSNTKSIHNHTGAFFIGNGRYVDCYPQQRHTSNDATDALASFVMDVGTPERLKVDSAAEFTGQNSEFVSYARKKGIDVSYAEPHRHEIGPIDVQIREAKKRWQEGKCTKDIPKRLWNYGIKHATQIMQVTPMEGRRTAFEEVTGKTPDISELLDFEFYDLVWYWNGVHPSLGDDAKDLGRWLGISKKVGTGMTYFVLTRNGKVISESTVQHVTQEDMRNEDTRAKVEQFNAEVKERLNDENFEIPVPEGSNNLDDTTQEIRLLAEIANQQQTTTTDNGDPDAVQKAYTSNIEDNITDGDDEFAQLDSLIGATIKFDRPDGTVYGKVKKRVTDDRGKGVGNANKNPLLDTREYEVELTDGTYEKYQANVIAENIYAQTDDEGRESLLLAEICGHRKDGNAIPISQGYTLNRSGEQRKKITTAGWHIKVQWTDGSTDELPLSVVKESNPIELAEYAMVAGLTEEPAFKWWVPHTLRTRNRIIQKARVIKKAAKYWRTTNKFGIELPHSVKEALELDKKNGNTFWRDALMKEMKNVRVAFYAHEGHTADQVRRGEAKTLIGFNEIKCHIIFDVKMDFTRKARFVAGGHLTDAPACMTYSSVVSRDSVRLAFMIAALNDLKVSATDVGNAYLNAECREKVWFQAGLECGAEDEGKVMVITRALYGLKSSGAAWRAMFSDFIIKTLGFASTIVDQDVYRRKSFYQDANGTSIPYYELLLVYVDDVLLISKNPDEVMEQIGKTFRLKEGYGKPTTYLGAETYQHVAEDGSIRWVLGSGKYVKNIVEQVKEMLEQDGRSFKVPNSEKKQDNVGPLHPDYKPELDTSDLLDTDLHARYQQIIGMLRWAVELGRIDIQIDVAIMSQYLAAPRTGHLEAVYGIVRYLAIRPDRRLMMSPTKVEYPEAVENSFNSNANWKEFYGEVIEEDPAGMPTPLGQSVRVGTFLDADHAGNVVTRRSHTGIFIFVNNSLIVQYSKKQNTVESATFGAEMVAMRVARDLTVALRIKLKMFGVPIDGPADFFCDNDSVVKNTSIPTSMLAKKHNSVNYHIIRESAAAGILRVAKIPTGRNYADALTKILPMYKRNDLLNSLLYYPSQCNILDEKPSGELKRE